MTFIVMSSMGADAVKATVFYSKTKGEMECDDVLLQNMQKHIHFTDRL